MIGIKTALILLVIVFSSTISLCQKYFEGRLTQEVTNSMNGGITSNMISYYKDNLNRTDYNQLTAANPFSSISIVDFEKRERLMLMDMPKINNKSATLSDFFLIERPIERIEKFEDYKIILGHKCQRITITSIVNGKETVTKGYADLNYLLKALMDFNGKIIDYPLFFESEVVTPSMTITMNILSISEETLSPNLFNTNIPSDYKLIDIRKKKSHSIISSDNVINNSSSDMTTQSYIKKEEYIQYTNDELETKLAEALKIEDFDTAVKLKEVIEKRGGSLFKYKSKTIAELQEMLKKAVETEDFDAATQIQEEIKKREKK